MIVIPSLVTSDWKIANKWVSNVEDHKADNIVEDAIGEKLIFWCNQVWELSWYWLVLADLKIAIFANADIKFPEESYNNTNTGEKC